jgi:transcriptional regulator with XRE-family HTH domain
MYFGIEKTPYEVSQLLAQRVKELRAGRKMSRATLAEYSGVPAPTIRHFEVTGKISLESLLKISKVFNKLLEFEELLLPDENERRRKLFDD